MSTLKVDNIRHNNATSDAITMASDGTCTAKLTSVGGGQLSHRNICINGADMMVAQRGTSTTGLQNTGGVYTIDRFAHRRGGTWSNAVWKDEQVNSGTGLFRKALKKTTTTAEGSAAGAGQFVMIGHYLEAGDTMSAFGDGTAEAKTFTVSFYVKASIATTYCLHLSTAHLGTNKGYMIPFTVNSAGAWERKTCTFPAITNSISTIANPVSDSSTGYRIHWVLDAPTGSQAANTYFNFTSGFAFPTGVSPTGFANTLNATFELGGVQIEAGSVATELEHRVYADELRRCQRYYEIVTGCIRALDYTNYLGVTAPFKVTKRAVPTNTLVNLGLNSGVSFQSFIGGMDDICKQEGCFIQFNAGSGGYSYGFRIHSVAEL
jgi:hypothetical protein